ncbi:MAG: aquaporin [Proteobacteria bacterium]|nr:aquaporin [Pseudomonadota bacterium]
MGKYLSEVLGTCLFVLFGCGSAVLAGGHIGLVGVALSFGFALLMLTYWLEPISGCHLNPAVTLVLAFSKKFPMRDIVPYIIAQLVGGILGGYLLLHIAQGHAHFSVEAGFACNGFGEYSPGGYSELSGLITEVVMTTVLLLAALAIKCKKFPVDASGLFMGVTLASIHLLSLPVTNTSVNIARSLGVAVIHGGWAMQQLWLFGVAQLLAVVIAVVIFKVLEDE